MEMALTPEDRQWIEDMIAARLEAMETRLLTTRFRARGTQMMITIDKESWERGVRDGFAAGRRRLCPDTADPYSYWSGFTEGEAARQGYEVTVDVAKICGLLPPSNEGEACGPRT
jgi:hypothetical protein